MNKQNIVLMGFMGSGKSSVGAAVAQISGFQFLDLDNLISKRSNASISEIFQNQGEAAFRRIESDTLSTLPSSIKSIISLGGGTPAQVQNQALIKALGFCVYLETPLSVCLKRCKSDPNRPLLQQSSQAIQTLWETRDPLYRALANYVISTETLHPRKIAQKIWTAYNAHHD